MVSQVRSIPSAVKRPFVTSATWSYSLIARVRGSRAIQIAPVHVLFSRGVLSNQGAFSERCHTHELIRASCVCYSAAGHGGEIATMSDFSFFELVGPGDL